MKAKKNSLGLLEAARAEKQAGRTAEAEAFYRKVLFKNPEQSQALFELSALLFELGRFEEASRFLERLVKASPSDPVLLTNLGESYRRARDLGRAAAAFERILTLDPDFPEAHHNLGLAYVESGKPSGALPHLERAVALRPQNARFRVSLAWALLQLRRIEESIAEARRAVELEPSHAPAHLNLGNALNDLGDRRGAIQSYRRTVELDPTNYRAHSNLILVELTDPSFDAAALGAEARAWASLHAEPLAKFQEPPSNDRDPARPLRIGYVSPDFRGHAVQQFLMPLFRAHDTSQFEVYLYSSVEQEDGVTAHYRKLVGPRFREIQKLSDLDAANLVRRDRIDVLVDLAVHGAGHRLRLFAYKPAPVQITWLGYSGTTGMTAMDYRITDPHFDPGGTDLRVYAEASIHLPECFWCYDALEPGLGVEALPALGRGFVTFGCLNNFRKVPPEALSLWGRVLEQVPGSRLALLVEDHPRVRRLLEDNGIASERVDFGGRVSRREYLERYHGIDIGLDTFPFAGGTTSLDAFWMGVPVVTLSGRTTLQRAGVTIAKNLGLPELVATTEGEFVSKAASLAKDLERAAELRALLRPRLESSIFGDAPRFARHLEAAYRWAFRRFSQGLPPESTWLEASVTTE
jgi:protein O-GlcNAc transferase